MSKLIVEMEMPDRCCDCDFADGAVCMAKGGVYDREVPKMTWIKTRPSWCPIVGVLPEDGFSGGVSDEITKAWERYLENERARENSCRRRSQQKTMRALRVEKDSETCRSRDRGGKERR